MRRFTKSNLDKWNERLKKVNLSLSLNEDYYSNVITIYENSRNWCGYLHKPTALSKVPEVSYLFNFSVSKKCSKRFYDLLREILESGTEIHYTRKDETNSGYLVEPFICKKNLTDFKIDKSDIKIHNLDYIQNTCRFDNVNLFEIIHFVNSVESTVEIISNYFEYDEDGKEICKTKFQVNEIVSTKEDKSGNYMILDFSIQQDNTIYYKVSKIINNITSEVILFDGISILKEDDILPNREDRLNILLN